MSSTLPIYILLSNTHFEPTTQNKIYFTFPIVLSGGGELNPFFYLGKVALCQLTTTAYGLATMLSFRLPCLFLSYRAIAPTGRSFEVRTSLYPLEAMLPAPTGCWPAALLNELRR